MTVGGDGLAGRTAVITGASSGIGESAAWRLARAGAATVLVGLSDRVQHLVDRMMKLGLNAVGFRADVADYARLKAAYAHAVEVGGGRIDVAVHSAGVIYPGGVETSDPVEVKRTIDTNLLGLMYSSQLALRSMVRGGRIINVSSISGRVPSRSPAYTASKFGVRGFTEVLRAEAAERGVCVSCIEPGLVGTRFQRHLGDAEGGHPELEPDNVAEAILSVLRLPAHVNIDELVIRNVEQR